MTFNSLPRLTVNFLQHVSSCMFCTYSPHVDENCQPHARSDGVLFLTSRYIRHKFWHQTDLHVNFGTQNSASQLVACIRLALAADDHLQIVKASIILLEYNTDRINNCSKTRTC